METNQPNNNSANNDLLLKLSRATENKTPGSNSAVISSDFWTEQENLNTEAKTEIKETKAATNTPKTPAAEETKETTAQATTTTEEETKAVKPSKGVKEASARTAVGMLDFTQKLIFTPILNHRFKKKFTAHEVQRLDDGVEDATKSDLDEADLRLRTKWDRLLKKHTKKLEAIPLDATESADLEKAFYNYMDIKEKTLPPEYFLALTVVTVIGKRAIDVVFD